MFKDVHLMIVVCRIKMFIYVQVQVVYTFLHGLLRARPMALHWFLDFETRLGSHFRRQVEYLDTPGSFCRYLVSAQLATMENTSFVGCNLSR